jgi:carbon-monoxide dehydrogenase medium subunit
VNVNNFQYIVPSTLNEAISILAEEKGKAKILAGGTDLLPRMVERQLRPKMFVSLRTLQELGGIKEQEKTIIVGATCRLREVEKSSLIQDRIPMLSYAVSQMGSWQIRNQGTVGGNLCNASPAADMAAPLLVLNSEVFIQGPKGERRIALSDFFVGPEETVLDEDEIFTKVLIPKPPGGSGTYIKLGQRRAMEIAIVGVAVWVLPEARGERINELRIALSSVGPKPFRVHEAESRLKGERMEKKLVEEVAEIASRVSSPITDLRATREYREEMVRVLMKRALLEAMDRFVRGKGEEKNRRLGQWRIS